MPPRTSTARTRETRSITVGRLVHQVQMERRNAGAIVAMLEADRRLDSLLAYLKRRFKTLSADDLLSRLHDVALGWDRTGWTARTVEDPRPAKWQTWSKQQRLEWLLEDRTPPTPQLVLDYRPGLTKVHAHALVDKWLDTLALGHQRGVTRPQQAAYFFAEMRWGGALGKGKGLPKVVADWANATSDWKRARRLPTPDKPVYDAYMEWQQASGKLEEIGDSAASEHVRRWRAVPQ